MMVVGSFKKIIKVIILMGMILFILSGLYQSWFKDVSDYLSSRVLNTKVGSLGNH